MVKNVYRSPCTVPVIVVRFKCNVNFLGSFFEKYSNKKCNEKPSSENRDVPCGQRDGRVDGRADGQA